MVAAGLEIFLPAVSLLLALDQLLIVQPDLYLHTGAGPTKVAIRWTLLGLAAAGWFGAAKSNCATTWLVASIGVAASGPLRFLAWGHGSVAHWWAELPSAIAMLGIGGVVQQVPRSLVGRVGTDTIKRVLLHPFIGFGLISGLCAAGIFANWVGPVRSSLAIGGGLAAMAALSTVRRAESRGRMEIVGRWLGYALLVGYATAAFATERWLPLHRVLSSSHPVVFFEQSDRCSLELSSGQGAYHLFVDGELRFSSFDEKRWSESLVKPALARVQHPRSALVLSTGEGLIERELLKDPEVDRITSVVRCPLVPEAARRSAWLRLLNQDAMNSPKVTLVTRDPASYLKTADPAPYDLIIVDLPDPSGPAQSKYYSRYFYRLLAAHMHDASVLVVQGTSARRSPRTFATIGATLRAAGFSIQPEVVPLIARGEWSLHLAALGSIPPVGRPEWLGQSLAATTAEQFNHPWPDTMAPADFVAEPSTLYDSKVLDWFTREAEDYRQTDRAEGASTPEPPTVIAPPLTVAASTQPSNIPAETRTVASVTPVAPTMPCHLLAIGDSLTDPKSSGGRYLDAARRRCGCSVTNIGKGGAMVNQMRARLVAHFAATDVAYSHVIIFGGVNDLYSDLTAKRSVEKIVADLEAMYRSSQARGARVIGITVTPWGGFRRYFTPHRWQNTLLLNRWIRDSQTRGLTDAVVDGERLLSCGTAERLCEKYVAPFRDGLHFGPPGHLRLGAALVQALTPIRCESAPDDGPNSG